MNLLLMSNSKLQGKQYLEYALPHIDKFLEETARKNEEVLFIPYAGVTRTHDEYEELVATQCKKIGCKVQSIHRFKDPKEAVKNAKAILVGGGNTFVLLSLLHENGLVDLIHKRVVEDNVPYMGWSAGSVIASPSLKTTNDMPIQEPKSFNSLNLIPFHYNAHYPLKELENHFGETREQRLNEFLVINPNMKVAALEEGTMFRVNGDKMSLWGEDRHCRIFEYKKEVALLAKKDDVSFLLNK